jgi:crossover junction endodeoxyribonuclease RusA
MPLLEFTVSGQPVSYQTKDKAKLKAWMSLVRASATAVWGVKTALTGKLKCTIINFHEGSDPPLDDDNMVKPIRDAMNGLVYLDDRQITYSETVQLSIDAPVRVRHSSLVLLLGYNIGAPFVYVRIDDAPEKPPTPSIRP